MLRAGRPLLLKYSYTGTSLSTRPGWCDAMLAVDDDEGLAASCRCVNDSGSVGGVWQTT